MRIEERLEALRKVESIAALAGLPGSIDERGEDYRMVFGMDGGRGQGVYVRPIGFTPDGRVIVNVFSPAAAIPKGLFKGLGTAAALDLLKRNQQMPFARFGILDLEKETVVVASVDALLDTLDAEELKSYAFYTALAADKYESERGGDRF